MILLVASSGGHIKELRLLAERLGKLPGDRLWVTPRTPQTEVLLAGEQVHWAVDVLPRDVRGVLVNSRRAASLLRRKRVEAVVSTGAGIALSYMTVARSMSIPCHYIESAARLDAPSLTGRLLDKVPGVQTYTQHPTWASERWPLAGSIFDAFEAIPAAGGARPALDRVVVTVGTMFGFRRMALRLNAILPQETDVLWQVGPTDVADLPIRGRDQLPAGELDEAIAGADAVVTHAGVGSVLAVLEAGKVPVVLSRQHRHLEHVDDHQGQIAGELERKGLALARTPDDLMLDDLLAATGRAVRNVNDLSPLALQGV